MSALSYSLPAQRVISLVIKILNCDQRSTRVRYLWSSAVSLIECGIFGRVRYLWSSAVSLVSELFFRFLSPSDSLTMVFVSNNQPS
jgi:hypothetical protein